MLRYGWIALCLCCFGCGIQQHQQDSIALAEAVAQKNHARVEELLAKGANPHYRNKTHLSAFAEAGQNNDAVMLKYFIDLGARPEVDPMAYLLSSSPVVLDLLEKHWGEAKKDYLPVKARPYAPKGTEEEKLAFFVRWARPIEVQNYLTLGADPQKAFVEDQSVLEYAKAQLETAKAVGIPTETYAKVVAQLEAALAEEHEG